MITRIKVIRTLAEAAVTRSMQIWLDFDTRDAMLISSLLYSMINAKSAVDHSQAEDSIEFSRDLDESF